MGTRKNVRKTLEKTKDLAKQVYKDFKIENLADIMHLKRCFFDPNCRRHNTLLNSSILETITSFKLHQQLKDYLTTLF